MNAQSGDDWSTVPSPVSKVKSPTSSGPFPTSRRFGPSMPSGTLGEAPLPQQELPAVSGDPLTPQKSPYGLNYPLKSQLTCDN
ncbi:MULTISPECIES: hypothetical protein [Kamptonema]|uniref:hypothetical protein n=1 Tax=Kamptonema TaxID=1501433 RepID=UPI0001DACFFF|nr:MULTISPECIES: hypothetical protein [Kamptonema]CBN54611.1 hypothetical protein OSCI_1000004 [Kamptonema sp. PCC 6506]